MLKKVILCYTAPLYVIDMPFLWLVFIYIVYKPNIINVQKITYKNYSIFLKFALQISHVIHV